MPSSEQRPLKVFLCHAHTDATFVRDLYLRLTKDGVEAWLDKEKLIGGQDWEFEIRRAVRESDVVVVCLSKQFAQKGFRQYEVRIALEEANLQPEGEIFIVPLRLEECNVPQSLRRWHWVDLFEEDGNERLMRALRARADRIGATLQLKRNWLPKATPRRSEKSIPAKKSIEPKQETEKDSLSSDVGVGGKVSGNVINLGKQEIPEPVKPAVSPRPQSKKKTIRRPETALIVAIIGLVGTVVAAWLGSPALVIWMQRTPVPTETPTASLTSVSASIAIFTKSSTTPTSPPELTPTDTVTPTLTPHPTAILDDRGAEMVLVPAGEFSMGVDPVVACQTSSTLEDCEDRYKKYNPLHTVFLEAFYVDKYEVTNTKYQECVSAGQCDSPANTKLGDLSYYGNEKYATYPVVWVSRENAEQFCAWREARLPTSAEWEKAARGTDQRIYPWGAESDTDLRANGPGSSDGYQVTAPIGSFSFDKSPYGAFDMAGNVTEYVSDNVTYTYSWGTRTYPMTRGGGWAYGSLVTYHIDGAPPSGWSYNGFRCARDVNP